MKKNEKEKVENKKQPYTNFSWVVFIALIAFGCFILYTATNEGGIYIDLINNPYLSMLIFLLYGFISCMGFYALGKFIFGKLAGYKLSYINLFLVGYESINGKLKPCFGGKYDFSFKVGLLPNKEKPNTKLALWGGSIALAIVTVLTAVLAFVLTIGKADAENYRYFFIFVCYFYIAAFVANMLPCKMDHLNDGFALLLMKKENALDVYHRNLKNYNALLSGGELEYVEYGEALDPLRMEGNIYNYYYLLDNERFEEAEKLAEFLATNNKYFIEESHINTALVARIYTMCRKHEFKELEEYYWKLDSNTRHILTDKSNLESVKTSLYISTFIDVNYEEYHKTMSSLEKTKKKYYYPARVELESKLINIAQEEILKEHPEWAE